MPMNEKYCDIDSMLDHAAELATKLDFAGAKAIYLELLESAPETPRALHGLGVVSYRSGNNSNESIQLIRQAIDLKPDYLDAYFNLIKILNESGRFVEAESYFQAAMNIPPDSASVCTGLGRLCGQKKLYAEAVHFFKRSIEYTPDAKGYIALGEAFLNLQCFPEAAEAFRSALNFNSESAEALYGLARIYLTTKNFIAAEQYIIRALKFKPSSVEYMKLKAEICRDCGKIQDALSWLESAVNLEADQAAYSNLLFIMNYSSNISQETIVAGSRQWEELGSLPIAIPPKHDLLSKKRIRVGYLSAEFKKHVVAFFFEPLLVNHNRETFEIHCFSNVSKEDEVTEKFKHHAECWHDISFLSDVQAANLIRQSGIDILIETSGHTADNRLGVLARRAAPIQITWLGYPNTTGLSAMDYRITDQVTDPDGTGEQQNTEQLIRLTDGFLCFTPPLIQIPQKRIKHQDDSGIRFGCYNYLSKMTQEVIDLWSELLNRLPDSKLVLKCHSFCDPVIADLFVKRFTTKGIKPSRIACLGALESYSDHLASYNEIDIALDPFPYNGTTTTFEALYMGVPLVTLRGNRHAARVGTSILSCLGMRELIAEDENEYLDIAVQLAADRGHLTEYHSSLRQRLLSSPLCDSIGFTKKMEQLFSTVWQESVAMSMLVSSDLDTAFTKAREYIVTGEFHKAEGIYRAILAEYPEHTRALRGMAASLYRRGYIYAAIKHLEVAVSIAPDFADAWHNLGSLLAEKGDVSKAIEASARAVALTPDNPSFNLSIGTSLIKAGRYDEAESFIEKSLQLKPDDATSLFYLASIAYNRNDKPRAMELYNQFLVIDEANAEAHTNLGLILTEQKQPEKAVYHCRRSVEINPHFALGWLNYGCALERVLMLGDALAAYHKAQSLDPSLAIAFSNSLLLLNYLSGTTSEQLYQESVKYGQSCSRLQGGDELWKTASEGGRCFSTPINVGLVSPDFRRHPVGYFILPLLRYHKAELLRIVCYSDTSTEDDMTETIRSLSCLWHNTRGMNHGELARKILDDRIDILIDLAGHTGDNRLPLFALKPSPVQMTWAGYVGTTGVDAIDFLISDRFHSPEGAEKFTTEKIVRLPDSYICYEPPAFAPEIGSLPLISNGYVTFGSFNNLAKLSDDCISIWAEILRKIPDSRLFIKSPSLDEPSIKQRTIERFADFGISAGALVLEGASRPAEMLARYAHIDIHLDTIPYSGGLTTLESLWMGVPVVTMPGELFSSRHSLSHLMNSDNPDWVARSREEYVEIACKLASEPEKLSQIRHSLRNKMATSPICDGKKFTENMQTTLLNIFKQRCSGLLEAESAKELHIQMKEQGDLLSDRGDLVRAKEAYEEALKANPSYVPALNNLALVCFRLNDAEASQRFLEKAIELEPTFTAPYVNLANIMEAKGRLNDAATLCRTAISFDNQAIDAHNNLGSALLNLGNAAEAIDCFRKVLLLKPDYHQVHSNLLFAMHSIPGITPSDILQESLRWNEAHAKKILDINTFSLPESPLNIGFISPDLRSHPVGYFVQAFAMLHDTERYHLYCYSDSKADDEMTELLRDSSEQWKDVQFLSDTELAVMIREDRIHILIDLAGHTNSNRLKMFSMRPAPIQMTWAGYVGTTGVEAVDYLISDSYHSPPSAELFTTEKIIRMPDSYICYCPPVYSPDVAPLPAAENGFITFGSFNKLAKLSSEAIKLWSSVLLSVEGSRMLIKNRGGGDPDTVTQLQEAFEKHGVSFDRLIFEGISPHHEMLEAYSKIDIQLDTIPYSGGLTTLESLWMGVPVITMPGELFSSRHSLSHLMNAGYPEWVAAEEEEFVKLAASLADNIATLTEIRKGLRSRVETSPLCDGLGFTEHLQNVFSEAWLKWGALHPEAVYSHVQTATMELGLSLIEKKDFLGAAEFFELLVEQESQNADAHNNLGIAYFSIGLHEAALDSFRMAIRCDKELAEAHKNLGKALRDIGGSNDVAERHLRKALKLNPVFPDAWMMLGNLMYDKGLPEKAYDMYTKTLNIAPDDPIASSNRLFVMNYLPRFSQEDIYRESLNWGKRISANTTAHNRKDIGVEYEQKLLRIGYVSGDFRRHPVGYYLAPVFSHHDKTSFSIFCYSTSNKEDDLTLKLKSYVEGWRDIGLMDNQQITETISADQIDILVDLSGHTEGHRLSAFALRQAPVQMTWLGYFNTTGLPEIDYMISDSVTTPPEEEQYYSEKILRLPANRFCYEAPEYAPESTPSPCINNGYITFGSFNNIAKITNEVTELWSRILLAVPDSKLILKWPSLKRKQVRDRIIKQFKRHGVDESRLILRRGSPHQQMLGEYGEVDIALDPFPFTGGLTSSEALWMGVPVVTLSGNKPSGRQTAGFLTVAGLPELIGGSLEQYLEIAVSLAASPERCVSIRSSLREKMKNSPLCDGEIFTKGLEKLFSDAWSHFLKNRQLPISEEQHNDIVQASLCYNSGVDAMERGDNEKAMLLFVEAVSIKPDFALAYNNIGIIEVRNGNTDKAENSFSAAISYNPELHEAHYNLGLIRSSRNQYLDAIELYDKAIEIRDDYADAYLEKGNALLALDEAEQALESYQTASAFTDGSAVISNNIGTAYLKLGNRDEAEIYFREAVFLDPEYIESYLNLGHLLCDINRITEAELVVSKALSYFSDDTRTLQLHARILTLQARVKEAVDELINASVLAPENLAIRSSLIFTLQYIYSHPDTDIDSQTRSWSEICARNVKTTDYMCTTSNDCRKINIGYISPDLKKHPVGFLLLPVLECHDRQKFRVVCYSDSRINDYQSLILESVADDWRNTSDCSTPDLRKMIADDNIDILVDLAGHTAENRLELFAMRAAPVQVSWLGYPDSTGVNAIDCRITDSYADPEEGVVTYSEENLVRLPGGFHCYHPPDDAPLPTATPMKANGYVTFGSFNNIAKLSPECLELWSCILHKVANSKLLLKYSSFHDADFTERFISGFAAMGISSSRIQCIASTESTEKHLECYGLIDIALDPFPYNGTTTTLEALFMGVPVLSLRGHRHAGRVGGSILGHLGLHELLAESNNDYVSLAASLASDITRLEAFRKTLRKRLLNSPFCDNRGFTAKLEAEYQNMLMAL